MTMQLTINGESRTLDQVDTVDGMLRQGPRPSRRRG